MKILAIDPGFERVGIAVIEHIEKQKDVLLYSDCFKTKKEFRFHERLSQVGKEIEKIIKKYKPEVMAIEKLYFTTNAKTVMNVAEARGVIVYSGSRNGLEICEYTPPEIKVAVTGYGKASKDMVIRMVPKLINMKTNISRASKDVARHDFAKSDDELDAIAVGLTCLAQERFSTGGKVLQRK